MLGARLRQSASTLGVEISKTVAKVRLKATNLDFRRKIPIDFTAKHFRVKTIDTAEEFKQVLALRHRVFKLEFSNKVICLGHDWDELDDLADHLVIIDEKNSAKKEVVGVYRLIFSKADGTFYSESEFNLSHFLATAEGIKLEMSRACIDQNYRSGAVIALLWKGLAEYAKVIEAKWLFGLSSVKTTSMDAIVALHRHFCENGLLETGFKITPQIKFKIPDFDRFYLESPATPGHLDLNLIPPLLKSYTRAGAKICSQPVIDYDFDCCDWLTVLNMRNLTEKFERKFMETSAPS